MELHPPAPELSDEGVILREWRDTDAPAVAVACRDLEIVRWTAQISEGYTSPGSAASARSPAPVFGKCHMSRIASTGDVPQCIRRNGHGWGLSRASEPMGIPVREDETELVCESDRL